MANWVIAGRTTSKLMCATSRSTIASRSSPVAAAAATARFSFSPSARPFFTLRSSHISPTRSIRRELFSLLPVHTAIASASLVSKLPTEANASAPGRFANYVSPI